MSKVRGAVGTAGIAIATAMALAFVAAFMAGCAARPPVPQTVGPAPLPAPSPAAPSLYVEKAMPASGGMAIGMASGNAAASRQAGMGGYPPGFSTEEYQRVPEQRFLNARDNPVSTFSVDVDTASYSNVRRFLNSGRMPPEDAVRIEEFLNYFSYGYPEPVGGESVAADFALSRAPWKPGHFLLRVAVKAREIRVDALPPSNLVFLVDTSGSMSDENKLPLIKESMRIMAGKLRPQDRVSIVAYAGSAGLVLDATPGTKKETIMAAFDRLEAGGSTAGGAGILLAYDTAKRNFLPGGNNRVILCTDGDFNVGVSSTGALERIIEEKRKENVYLTILGVGMGNFKDSRMETLADKGNGNYAYIDNLLEGKKVLGKEIWGNLFAVAKDVKIQIEFNPAKVSGYRLIGYDNRVLAREDFNNDAKDAGEMGSGQSVTAFYEIVPAEAGAPPGAPAATGADPLAFQKSELLPSDDLALFRLRYKSPEGPDASRLVETRLAEPALFRELDASDEDFRFAAAVIEFGLCLVDSPFKGQASWKTAMERARAAKGKDREGYRAEFVRLVESAELLASAR